MDGLMEKLEATAESNRATITSYLLDVSRKEGWMTGYLHCMELVQQHLDHADELRIAEEDAGCADNPPFHDRLIAAHQGVRQLLHNSKEADTYPICRDYLGAAAHSLKVAIEHLGTDGTMEGGPRKANTPDAYPHLDIDGEPGVTDGEDDAEAVAPLACLAHLSFVELAEETHAYAAELLRRRREQYNHDADGSFQEGLEEAAGVLEIAMMPESANACPRLDIDGEPGVADGGVPT